MKLFQCVLLTALACALAGLSIASTDGRMRTGGSVPVEISVTGGVVGAGNTVTYQVRLDNVAGRDQVVTITASAPSAYSSIPSTMTVCEGSDVGTFQATIAENPPVAWTVYASCNGGTAAVAQVPVL